MGYAQGTQTKARKDALILEKADLRAQTSGLDGRTQYRRKGQPNRDDRTL